MPNSDWLTKPRALSLFLLASVVMLGSGVLALGLYVLSVRGVLSPVETSTTLRTFCGLTGVVAAPSGIYLAIGMLWYWAKVDPSPRPYKVLWLLLFLVTGFFGVAIYSLVVYRTQITHRISASEYR